MLLSIDVGNTNIKVGLSEGERWLARWQIRTLRDQTGDEYGVTFRSLLAHGGFEASRIERAVLSCVVPPVLSPLKEMLADLIDSEPLVVGAGLRTGLRVRTENPKEVGTDLLASAAAAYDRFHTHCIVAGFGTALTFTAVADPGELLGVAIAPGLQYAAEALAAHTAQLRLVPLEAPPAAIGRNTVHSIQSGIIYGFVGMVEALIDRIKAELPGPARVIGTGGQARIIAPLTTVFTEIDPWLTLAGLRLIAGMNPGGKTRGS
jgi:type III pantothenate kinase